MASEIFSFAIFDIYNPSKNVLRVLKLRQFELLSLVRLVGPLFLQHFNFYDVKKYIHW